MIKLPGRLPEWLMNPRIWRQEVQSSGYENFSSGLGFLLTYDTRDIPANAYNGTYLDFRGMMYSKVFGSDNNFYRLEIDYRQYKTVGRRKVIAWTVQS